MKSVPQPMDTNPGKTLKAYLDLVRLPNLFTAAADVLAGFLFAGGKPGEWFVLIRLIAASACLYAGGVALNDVCDVKQDAAERPHRPIPSGRIARPAALRVSGLLLLCGVALSATVSGQALLIATAITASIIAYNLLKHTPLAPPMMGLCRALNLLLGMYGLETLVPPPAARPLGVMFLYVASLTVFARREARSGSQLRLWLGTAGIAAAVLSLLGLRWFGYNARYGEYRYLAAAMFAGVLVLGVAAILRPSPQRIQCTVRSGVLGIILLDACIAWVSAGPLAALGVAALLIPSIFLARSMRVT